MSLGKRTRHPMRRTPSVSGITFDLNLGDGAWPSDLQDDSSDFSPLFGGGLLGGRQDQRSVAMVAVSPRALHRRHSSEFLDAAHFLRTCCLCKRRLFPGRDIYMYRGDSAFCSLECRQQQMNLDERKENCGLASKKEPSTSTSSSAAAAMASSKGETVVAAVV